MILIALVIVATALVYYSRSEAPTVSVPKLAGNDAVVVKSPAIGEKIHSPAVVSGLARGTWFFEASFLVKVLDGDGTELGHTPAQAQSDWMTTDFVPFNATLTFSAPKFKQGTIVLEKDNPSGLPQNDGELRLPVKF